MNGARAHPAHGTEENIGMARNESTISGSADIVSGGVLGMVSGVRRPARCPPRLLAGRAKSTRRQAFSGHRQLTLLNAAMGGNSLAADRQTDDNSRRYAALASYAPLSIDRSARVLWRRECHFWKQFTICLIVIAAGVSAWAFFVPGARDIGCAMPAFPKRLSARRSTSTMPTGGARRIRRAGRQTVARRQMAAAAVGVGRNAAVLVVTQAVVPGTVNDRLSAIGTGDAIRSVVVTPQASGLIRRNPRQVGRPRQAGAGHRQARQRRAGDRQGQADVALKAAVEKSSLYNNIKSSVSRMDVFD